MDVIKEIRDQVTNLKTLLAEHESGLPKLDTEFDELKDDAALKRLPPEKLREFLRKWAVVNTSAANANSKGFKVLNKIMDGLMKALSLADSPNSPIISKERNSRDTISAFFIGAVAGSLLTLLFVAIRKGL